MVSRMERESGVYNSAQYVRTNRHAAGANGARPERGTSYEYGTLASEGLKRDTVVLGPLGSGYDPKETLTVGTVEMETVDPDRHCARPMRGQP